MKKFIVLPGLIFFFSVAFAQENETKKTFRKDIGFNTTFILQEIFQSNQTPFSLMYKKYTSENKATRFGIDGYFNLEDNNSNVGSSSYTNSSSASVYLAIGREFQKPINERWTWYYGGDLVPFFSFNNQDTYQGSDIYSEYESSRSGIALRPFLAIRYNINPRLYLSAEATLSLQYAHTKNYGKYSNNNEPYADFDGNNVYFSLNPASGIFLFYRF